MLKLNYTLYIKQHIPETVSVESGSLQSLQQSTHGDRSTLGILEQGTKSGTGWFKKTSFGTSFIESVLSQIIRASEACFNDVSCSGLNIPGFSNLKI